MDKSSKKRRLPNPPKTSEDYPFNLLTELEKRKKRSNILVPLGLAYLLWKWSEPYEERDRWEDRYKRRKVKVKHRATIKESELDKVVATLMEKGWSEKRIKAYLVRKAYNVFPVHELANKVEQLSTDIDIKGHDYQISAISDLINALKGNPIKTDSGLYKSDDIVAVLDQVAVNETGVSDVLWRIAEQLRNWS